MTTVTDQPQEQALAVRDKQQAIARPMSGDEMVERLKEYKDLQNKLDHAMPEAIINLEGKPHRKKMYWRAIRVAFGLTVEPVEERYEERGQFDDGRPNFGYIVTYRASDKAGNSVTGDGACFAVEKARRFRCPHPQEGNPNRTVHFPHDTCPDFDPAYQWKSLPAQSTDHNIRSHAHTRAFNRAVSNLVGFGEVSAEEIVGEDDQPVHAPQRPAPQRRREPTPDARDTQATEKVALPGGVTTVVSVKKYPGENARGKYTKYQVHFSDGRKGGTFSDTVGQRAEELKGTGVHVVPELKQDGQYWNLVAMPDAPSGGAVAQDAPPKPEMEQAARERVLTVRQLPQSDVHVVQGSEREYYTKDAGLIDECKMMKGSPSTAAFGYEWTLVRGRDWVRVLKTINDYEQGDVKNGEVVGAPVTTDDIDWGSDK